MTVARPVSPARRGDWVEVRSKEEVLATLDERGCLDGMPFMPEMLQFCGRRLQIFKRAHKTCDTINKTGGRRLTTAVHLEETRCNGAAHGGCQARCLIVWKEAWLKPVSDDSATHPVMPSETRPPSGAPRCTEAQLMLATQKERADESEAPIFVCQATQLPAATTPLRWWDVRQYMEDLTSRNVTLGRLVAGFLFFAYDGLINLGLGFGAPLRWLYDRYQALVGGVPYPMRRGTIPAGAATPVAHLHLQPGEWVRVKDFTVIRATLDTANKNRGMYFDCEEVPFCGGTYKVVTRVSRIIDEKTGRMLHFKNPSVILDGVYCQARYSAHRLFCPRSIHPMWREIWLERVDSSCEGGPKTQPRR
jgi:hypothetical protein